MRTVFCVKLNREAEGFDVPPYPGELGRKIYDHISKEAWQQWLSKQVMLINEYRLNLSELSAREFLAKEMEKDLFGEGSEMPRDYQPLSDKTT